MAPIGAVAGGASRVLEILKGRTISSANPLSQEIEFGGSTGSIEITPVAGGPPADYTTLVVRMSGGGGSYQQTYDAKVTSNLPDATYYVNESKSIPLLPNGTYIVEVFSSSQSEWAVDKVILRYSNGMSNVPTPSPWICPSLFGTVLVTLFLILMTFTF